MQTNESIQFEKYEETYRNYMLAEDGTPEKTEALITLCNDLLYHLQSQEESLKSIEEVFNNVLQKVNDQKVLKPEEYKYIQKLSTNFKSLVQQLRRLRAGLTK